MEEVKLAVAQPGDVLVVGFNDSISGAEYKLLVERFKPLMDMGIQVFLVEHCSSLAVVRPGEDVNGAPLRRRETLEGYEVPGER